MDTDNRIVGFDLLRGVCVLGIVVSTVYATQHSYFFSSHNLSLYGLYIFYALSGACLFIAYSSRLSDEIEILQYFVNRLLRILPLYFVAIVIAVLLVTSQGRMSLGYLSEAYQNATLMISIGNPGMSKLVTGGWAVGLVFAFYLMFPVLAVLIKSRARLVIVVVALLAQILFVQMVLRTRLLSEVWIMYSQPASLVGYFMAGCYIGWLASKRRRTAQSVFWLVALVGFLAVIVAYQPPTPTDSLKGVAGIVLPLVACAAVYAASLVEIPSALAGRLIRIVADCSYAIFLLHFPVVVLLRDRLTGLPDLVALLVIFAVVIPLAFVANRFFEVPVRRLLSERFSRWQAVLQEVRP